MSHSDADSMNDFDSEQENNNVGSTASEKPRLAFCRMNISFLIIDASEHWAIRMMMPVGTPGTICRNCEGVIGPEVGDHVSCECEAAMAMQRLNEIWWQIDFQFTELYDEVYEYILGLGVDHYFSTIPFEPEKHPQLGKIIADHISNKLGIEVLSRLPDEYK